MSNLSLEPTSVGKPPYAAQLQRYNAVNTFRSFTAWLLLAGSSILGFSVFGTAALMAGSAISINLGLAIWVVGAIASGFALSAAIRRAALPAIGCLILAPSCLALLIARLVLGVYT
ncbi:hypothetical protein RQP53_24565 [Paucibacter sp. APW11]|uniref:Uncharacterized protein n=1 Tax=Roseateles aquae TaxID=3077235 RepID=A0ABU3PIU0_9BURK|nr:hypothetical protein [Paucibacter sp. APW11]MDT9002468.1 hypothetical protein [Paucibacter sp. APW11]